MKSIIRKKSKLLLSIEETSVVTSKIISRILPDTTQVKSLKVLIKINISKDSKIRVNRYKNYGRVGKSKLKMISSKL